jgi:maltokinase
VKVDQLRPLLPAYLARQRWFAGGKPSSVEIADSDEIGDRLHWLLVDADGARYQLLVGIIEGMPPEFLHGHDAEVLGVADSEMAYDGLLDPELVKELVAKLAPDEEIARVRPMGAEQSNTSLVLDDRLVLKVFRRIHRGPNPDIEVTAALAAAGFEHVAAPVATWEEADSHLAVLQPYLAGGTDGWALALTSLRDLYGSECDDPADCGGDFAAEARRLGAVTASMHVAMAGALGTSAADTGEWAGLMERQLQRVAAQAPWNATAHATFEALRSMTSPGPAFRVHGDYHLGQVLRTDTGWFVLDFEGEPARPLDERRERSSPLKDVAGMVRSFHYATAVVLREREEFELEALAPKAEAWEARNRTAFLDGYLSTEGIAELLPPAQEDVVLALRAWELDKAVYEIAYERDHRPDWVDIPEAAIARLTGGAVG